ncbi:MAG: 3-oxoacyl-ACP synthase [Bacteroidota bacterium]
MPDNIVHINKTSLFTHCKNILLQHIADGEKAMQEAQEAANSEEKSSMGDKYETGRAMSQLARDMNASQVVKNKEELTSLLKLENTPIGKQVIMGSLVYCDTKLFYVSVALGQVSIEEQTVTVISGKAPLAKAMLGKQIGESFTFNNNTFSIHHIA